MGDNFYPGIIDTKLMEYFIEEQLINFIDEIEITPAPDIQFIRSGAIAWAATFMPEVFNGKIIEKILNISWSYRRRADYNTEYWWKFLYIDAAIFQMTGSFSALDHMIPNINHGKSDLRYSVHGPLGLIAPKVPFEKNNLIDLIGSNFAKGHSYNESALCICFALKGEWERKLSSMRNWKVSDDDESTLLSKILNKKSQTLHNYIVCDDLFQISRFLVCSLLEVNFSEISRKDAQRDLFSDKNINLKYNFLWERVQKHPLNDPLIMLP